MVFSLAPERLEGSYDQRADQDGRQEPTRSLVRREDGNRGEVD